MLPRIPLRYLLADDPGAGKTIMAGLLIKELRARGDLNNCLIVAPGGLVSNWQSELQKKFSLDFKILTRDAIDMRSKKNVFDDLPFCIARLDHLKPKNNRDNNDDKRKPLYAENVHNRISISSSSTKHTKCRLQDMETKSEIRPDTLSENDSPSIRAISYS